MTELLPQIIVNLIVVGPCLWMGHRLLRADAQFKALTDQRAQLLVERAYQLGYRNAVHDVTLGSLPDDDPGNVYEVVGRHV